MRQRRAEALQRCAKRAEAAGLPVACTVNPFARPQPEPPRMLLTTVLKVAADVTGVSARDMIGRRRGREISYARHFACWLLRNRLPDAKYIVIAHVMSKHHVSIMDGIDQTERRLAEDWPMVIGWRDRAAEILSRIDTATRRQQEHTEAAR